jgi:putative hemolysin
MLEDWQFFLILSVGCILFQAYFTMMEMALVSYNRIRLQFYISQGDKKALTLEKLLLRPTYLFGTTLIGVNFFLILGSESSRHFFGLIGFDPGWAIIPQIFIVVIFAELAPLFAARIYAEHVVRLGITPIAFLSKLLTPFIWVIDKICRFVDWLFRSPQPSNNYLTREELQSAIEVKETRYLIKGREEIDTLVNNIFGLRAKSPASLMTPLAKVPMVSYTATARSVKALLEKKYEAYLPLYYEKEENIFGILYTRDLLRLDDESFVRDVARSAWFITEKNSSLQVLKQFRWNNQPLAVVLDDNGEATGILTLEGLIEEIFQNTLHPEIVQLKPSIIIDRSFPSDTSIAVINNSFGILLPKPDSTLEELMREGLQYAPKKLDSLIIASFELTLEESPFLGEKTIRVRSL